MADRHFLRIGALAAFIGGGLALVANGAHPRYSVEDLNSNVASILESVADYGPWRLAHFAVIVGLVLWLATFAALSRSVGPGGETWARLAWVTIVVATTMVAVSLTIDGFAIAAMADNYAEAVGSAEQAAVAAAAVGVESISSASFGTWQLLLFGALLVYGLAITSGDRYPRYLGWAAYAVGVGGVVSGVIQLFAGFTTFGFLVLFTVASVLATLWILIVGWHQWRMAQEPASV